MPRLKRSERGANLVEMAFVAPFLILLLFGIIEFAWLFAQDLTIKHGAREGARLAAVTFGANSDELLEETCSRMNIVTNPAITVTFNDTIVSPSGSMDPGDAITVNVSQGFSSLTGIMDWVLAPITNLSSTVETRAEQTPASYWVSSMPFTCP